MSRRVAGRVQRDQIPSRQRHGGAVLEEHIRLRGGDELANAHRRGRQLGAHLLRDAGVDEQRIHAREQALRPVAIARWDQRGIGRMHRDPRTRRLAQATGKPVVVRMDVGDEDCLDVARRVSRQRHPGDERAPGLLRVPTGVDDSRPGVQLQQVHEHVPKRIVREWHRDRPEPRPDTLDVRQPHVIPGLPLRSPGHRDSAHRVGLSPVGRWDWPRGGPGRRLSRRPSARRGSNGIHPPARGGDSRRCSARPSARWPRG